MGLIHARADEPAVNPLFPSPLGCLVCARVTYVDDSPCGALFNDGIEMDPATKATGRPTSVCDRKSVPPLIMLWSLRPECTQHQRWLQESALIEKRGNKNRFTLCNSKNPVNPRVIVTKLSFQSSCDVMNGKTGGN